MTSRTIGASVGKDAKNRPDDVRIVQAMLNDVPVADGGPPVPLAVDGLAWGKTVGAITTFQKTALGHKWPDGRVDPGGKTFSALATHSRGEPERTDPRFTLAWSAGFTIAGASGWEYREMSSMAFGVGVGSHVHGDLIADHHPDKKSLRISFAGPGAGLAKSPFSATGAPASLPSTGTQFYRGRRPNWGVSPHPFVGIACMFTMTAALGAGNSGALILFGCQPRVRNLILHPIPVLIPPLMTLQLVNLIEALSYNSVWAFAAGAVKGLDAGLAAYVLDIKVTSTPYLGRKITV